MNEKQNSISSDSPDFIIVGPLRAGTTLLSLLMKNHPKIGMVGEFEESVAMLGDTNWPPLNEYQDWLSHHRVAQARNYKPQPDASSYQEHARGMWTQLSSRIDKPIIGCTIHSRFDRALELWPNAKLIHIIRDPRDVAHSCVGMGWVGHPVKGSRYWIEPTRRWFQLEEKLDHKDWIGIRYEDVLTDPVGELARCCHQLDTDFHPDMLKFHESSTYKPIDPTLANQWKNKPKRTLELIESECMPMMKSFGYEPTNPQAKPIGMLESFFLSFSNRMKRIQWRANRYGLVTTISWIIAKRLSLKNAWRTKIQLRINQIDTEHLR
jgi:Sulfotransferase family